MAMSTLVQIMDEFVHIVNTSPLEDVADKIVRQAGQVAPVTAIEALARMLVLENARRRHAEAKLTTLAGIDGNISASAGGDAQITAAGNITLSAPQIFQNSNVTTNGEGGGSGTVTETANRTQTGSLTVNGPVNINGPLSVSGGIDGKINGCSGC